MKKRILPIILCACLLLSAVTVGVFAATPDEGQYTAQIMDAYGGANGIVSMMFDDGDKATNSWLNEKFKEYNLCGSVAAIVRTNYEILDESTRKYVENEANTTWWANLFADGRIEPESHSYTHLVLPSDQWANTKEDPESYLANNTEENYQIEIVKSQQLIKEYFGHDSICFIPSNNTLSEGAMAVVKQYYYAVRQANYKKTLQSLDPVVGSHEPGGWYNLYMYSFGNNGREGIQTVIPAAVDQAAEQGGWLVAFSHAIKEGSEGQTNYDATYAEAEAAFQKMSAYQKEGKLWVATFGQATKYLREKQNSTVSYSYTSDKVSVSVTMAEKTADNLPLPTSIFNQPLTVKIGLPNGVEKVAYPMNGETYTASTFTEGDNTYAYVNVIPNSGEIVITPIADGGIFSASDFEEALTADGEYKVAGDIVLNNTQNLTMTAKNVTIDLCGNTITFNEKNTITVAEGASLTVKNGNVVVAHRYTTTSTKSNVSYFPVVEKDGAYAASEKAVSYTFTGDDLYRKYSAAAFKVSGGALLLDGVSLERSVSVSDNGELLLIEAGEVTLKDSKLFESASVEAWANASTRLIQMYRQPTPTKLTVIDSTIAQCMPNAYYVIDGKEQLLNAQNSIKSAVDAATGALDKSKVSAVINNSDFLSICYVEGSTANTSVEILVENSELVTYQMGFIGAKNYSTDDKLTMRNTRFENPKHVSNFNDRIFALYSAEMLFENCYLGFQNNVFYMQDLNDGKNQKNLGTTSITLKNSYLYGSHTFRVVSNANKIRLENSYVSGGFYQWTTEDANGEGIRASVTVAGKCYTDSAICATKEDIPSNNTAGTRWFNVTYEDGATFAVSTPTWYGNIRHADGTMTIIEKNNASTPYVLDEGSEIMLWKKQSATTIYFTAAKDFEVQAFGNPITFAVKGGGAPIVLDGTLPDEVSIIRSNDYHEYAINGTTVKTLKNTFSTLVSGETLVLHADQRASASLYSGSRKVAIDLNGYTIYHATVDDDAVARIEPLIGIDKDAGSIYVYSSKPGARLLNGYKQFKSDGTLEDKGGYVMKLSKDGTLALGYDINGEVRGERFSVISGALLSHDSSGTFLANGVDWYAVSGDNNTVIRFSNGRTGRVFYASNCNFYNKNFGQFINFAMTGSSKVSITFENSNLYGLNGTRRMWVDGYASSSPIQTTQTIVLKNTSAYNMILNTVTKEKTEGTAPDVYYVIEGECDLPEFSGDGSAYEIAPGYYYEKTSGTVTVSGTSYPQGSILGGMEMSSANGNYSYKTIVRSSKEYQKGLYTNVALDTALDLKLYVPVDNALASVKVDGAEALDKEAIQTINGKDYFVITISKAPKSANEISDIYLSYTNGTTVNKVYRLQQSLVNYAATLLNRDESKYTGKTLEYLVDSKEMMLYVLNYAKEAVERYGDLEGAALTEALAPIDKLLGDFTPAAENTELENVKTDLPTGIGAAAAFDLDTTVGFVLGVYNTFTGTVSIRLDDVEVTKSFTAYEAAAPEIGADNVLTLENIYAYQLYSKDIEITVEGTNGDTPVDVTFTYNLATYASSGVSGEVGMALYAYAKEAYAYGYKHSIGTIE